MEDSYGQPFWAKESKTYGRTYTILSSKPEHIIHIEDLAPLGRPKEFLLGNSEQELIAACIAGKRAAQKRIYELFAPKMLNVCNRYAKNRDHARDLMHDGFIKVFLNISSFRAEASLETWVTRIMINNSLTAIKKEVRRGIKVDINETRLPEGENVAPFDFEMEERQPITAKNVFETMEDLPLGYKTVLSLYILEGFTHREIAEQLGVTEGTSKSQLAKGKRLLAKLLKEKYQ